MVAWTPEELSHDPAEDASFVVFEGPKFGMMNLVISSWPQVDEDGRLQWEVEEVISAVPVEDLTIHDEVVIKDSYCYYIEGDAVDPSSWTKVINITKSTHEQVANAVQRALDTRSPR